MADNIHMYNMPDEQSGQTFRIFEVNAETLEGVDHVHQIGKPHRHKYYEIFFFHHGSGKHEIDFQTYPIVPNSIHFLSPGQVHLISRAENYYAFEIIFSRDFYLLDLQDKEVLLDLPYFNNCTTPVLNLTKKEFNDLMIPIKEISLEHRIGRVISNDIIRSYLHVFLLKCKHYFILQHCEQYVDKDSDYYLLTRFKALIELNFLTMHSVTEYADMMSMTSGVLNSRIKKAGGQNASELITDRILLEAKRLLLFSNLNSKEIAFRLNYEDPSYFSRVFKKRTGVNPSKFREQMTSKY
jgi:AraC family transcriptional regulator, transcriptional activator of pobA